MIEEVKLTDEQKQEIENLKTNYLRKVEKFGLPTELDKEKLSLFLLASNELFNTIFGIMTPETISMLKVKDMELVEEDTVGIQLEDCNYLTLKTIMPPQGTWNNEEFMGIKDLEMLMKKDGYDTKLNYLKYIIRGWAIELDDQRFYDYTNGLQVDDMDEEEKNRLIEIIEPRVKSVKTCDPERKTVIRDLLEKIIEEI